jgi:hypothetical protein
MLLVRSRKLKLFVCHCEECMMQICGAMHPSQQQISPVCEAHCNGTDMQVRESPDVLQAFMTLSCLVQEPKHMKRACNGLSGHGFVTTAAACFSAHSRVSVHQHHRHWAKRAKCQPSKRSHSIRVTILTQFAAPVAPHDSNMASGAPGSCSGCYYCYFLSVVC